MTPWQFWKPTREEDHPPPGFDWNMPCGAYFKTEAEASWHYVECDDCTREHAKRNFRSGY